MLDVQLDRHIDISHNLQQQWRARNVPNISGMEVHIQAWQDLELLEISVTLILPLPHRFNLLKRKQRQSMKKSSDLIDLNEFSDHDEEDDLTDAQIGQVEPIQIKLNYRLTSSELSIFGNSEVIESKKITLSQNSNVNMEQQHPETFIWNVLSRLHVKFQVIICNKCIYIYLYR